MPIGAKITGVILSHQLRSLNWVVRNADYRTRAPEATVLEVLARIEAALGIEPNLEDTDRGKLFPAAMDNNPLPPPQA